MMQFNFKWACAKCGTYHNHWCDKIDLKNLKFQCQSCFYNNSVKYKIHKDEPDVQCNVVPYFMPTMDIEQFVNILPVKPTRDLIASQLENTPSAMTLDEVIDIWCIHDDLHYITGINFTHNGEKKIRYLEEKFNIGCWSVDPKFNTYKPLVCNTSSITHNRIREVANQIKEYL